MKTKFIDFLNEETLKFTYKGYECIKDKTKGPGQHGIWFIPNLYYRAFGNKIEKGYQSISMIQCREAIDLWYDFSEKSKEYKENS